MRDAGNIGGYAGTLVAPLGTVSLQHCCTLSCSPSPQSLSTQCSAKYYCKYKNFMFGILKNEKLSILCQEVHLRNLVAHQIIISLYFSKTEFISVASENDKGNQFKKTDGQLRPWEPRDKRNATQCRHTALREGDLLLAGVWAIICETASYVHWA